MAINGEIHSDPVEKALAVLYCNVAAAPKAGAVETDEPSIERMPFTVGTVVNVTTPPSVRVRLLNVVVLEPEMICPTGSEKITVLLLAVNVPLFDQSP